MFKDDSDHLISSAFVFPSVASSVPAFSRASAGDFEKNVRSFLRNNRRYEEDISYLSDYEAAECWIMEGGLAGFAVKSADELCNVFSRVSGCGSAALKFAQNQYDRLHLNCYDKLENFYQRHGFEVLRREENWNNTDDVYYPSVVYMGWEKK